MSIQLTKDQKSAVKSILDVLERSRKIPVLARATGTGKTVVAGKTIKAILSADPKARVLVLPTT